MWSSTISTLVAEKEHLGQCKVISSPLCLSSFSLYRIPYDSRICSSLHRFYDIYTHRSSPSNHSYSCSSSHNSSNSLESITGRLLNPSSTTSPVSATTKTLPMPFCLGILFVGLHSLCSGGSVACGFL